MGFTYGVTKLFLWDNPQDSTFSAASATQDMLRFRQLINIPVPVLSAFANWILTPQSTWDKRMSLATDGSTTVLAYLPGDQQASSIAISTTGLPGLGCTWTSTWVDPVSGSPSPASCIPGSGRITFNKRACQNSDCDFVLQIKKGASAPGGASSTFAFATPADQRIDLWPDLSSGDGTSAITAYITAPGSSGHEGKPSTTTVAVAPPGDALQDQPQVVTIPNGYLATWQADHLDGSLLGVFARQINWRGQMVGPQFQVNLTTEENQRDPVVAGDGRGDAVIVWGSYGQDGDRGGIFARMVNAQSPPGIATQVRLGDRELPVNATTFGHQEQPQVIYLPTGNLVVAWQTRTDGDNVGAVASRVFNATGSPSRTSSRSSGSPARASAS